MQRQTLIILLLVTTLAALAAAWFWALAPLSTPLLYIHPTDWTDADLVRHIWHLRLVQPEWVSTSPDYLAWTWAETLTRLIVIFCGWLTTATFLARRYLRSRRAFGLGISRDFCGGGCLCHFKYSRVPLS